MPDLDSLTVDDFDPLVGSVFAVSTDAGDQLEIHLVEVARLGDRPGHRVPFALRFSGPSAPVLTHDTHHVAHADLGELDLFVGPIVSESAGVVYEAIFT